jgi:superfamily II RNA helicase
MIVPTNGSDENDPRRIIISFCDTYSHDISSSSIGDDTTTSTCRPTSAFRRRTRAGERRRRSRQTFSSSRVLAPYAIALIVVASYVPISRLGACHAFIIAPSNHRVPDPTPATAPRRSRTSSRKTLTVSPTERRSEAKVRLYQAKKSRTTERNRRNAADLTSSVDDAPTADDASRSNDDRLRRRKQQQEAFVELGRQSFARYFSYDLDDWQLEAGGAIAAGHNVIVCGTSDQTQRALYID